MSSSQYMNETIDLHFKENRERLTTNDVESLFKYV